VEKTLKVFEEELREQIAKEVETLLCGDNCLGVNQEHCDNIKSTVNLIRQESKYD
jgi:hypothetical protein